MIFYYAPQTVSVASHIATQRLPGFEDIDPVLPKAAT